MLNTVKMDLYRIFKSKSFYITILVTAISVVASISTLKYQESYPEYMQDIKMQESDDETIDFGITIGNTTKLGENSSTDDMSSLLFSGGVFLVMGAIFCVIYVCMDHNSGFIKNVISRRGYRNQTSISKGIIAIIYTLCQFIVSVLVFFLSVLVFFGEINIVSMTDIIGYIATQMLIQIALLMLCILVCNFSRSIGASMAFAICLGAGLFTLIGQLLDGFHLPVTLSNYMLSIITRTLPVEFDATIYGRTIIISVTCIIIYQVLSTLVMRRQDIK